MQIAHNIKVNQSYSCSFCNKNFTTKAGKCFHEKRHKGEKPYKCTHCDLAFDNPGMKSSHIRREHEQNRLYKCQKCQRPFLYPSHQKKHEAQCLGETSGLSGPKITYPNGSSPWRQDRNSTNCSYCHEKFDSFENLHHHLRKLHARQKPSRNFLTL